MALERLFDLTGNTADPETLYTHLDFPPPLDDKPTVTINMVSTADGKIVVGEPGGTAAGVGGPTDKLLFRRLQQHAEACLIGASTLRAGNVVYPPQTPRYTVTRTGNVPLHNRFFTDAPDRAFVFVREDMPPHEMARLAAATNVLKFGRGKVDLAAALRFLRQEQGIRLLLCEGGAALNDDLIRAGLADELFLTLAPKLKGGHLPTIVEGAGFPPYEYLPLSLLSLYRDGGELYLRYRLADTPERFPPGR